MATMLNMENEEKKLRFNPLRKKFQEAEEKRNTFKILLSKSSASFFSSLAHFGVPTNNLYLFSKYVVYNFSGLSHGKL